MISICMATYNGERFIEEQLQCIYEQTIPADEVIICDDDSVDCTREIIQQFIDTHGLGDKWRLIRNQERKGYPGNFYYCMSLATGDYVFLADQDDIWSLEKLEKMCIFLEKCGKMGVLACKMELVDSEGNDIKTLIKPNYSKETGDMQAIGLDRVLYKNEWSGMVLAYRNAWYQTIRQRIENLQVPHDLALCMVAAAEDVMYQMDSVLAWHRRHDNNAAQEEHRVSKLLDKNRKIADVEKYNGYLQDILQNNVVESEKGRATIIQKSQQMQKRAELLKTGKCMPVLWNYLKNPREIRLFTFLCDFLICMKN